MSPDDKERVLELFHKDMSVRDIAKTMGIERAPVSNYLYSLGLAGKDTTELPTEGVNRQWLLDNANVDVRRRNKALKDTFGKVFSEKDLAMMYNKMCGVKGSPEPFCHYGGNCETCEKRELCSWGYVRCESIQAWEDDIEVDGAMKIIEENPELYKDCYPEETI